MKNEQHAEQSRAAAKVINGISRLAVAAAECRTWAELFGLTENEIERALVAGLGHAANREARHEVAARMEGMKYDGRGVAAVAGTDAGSYGLAQSLAEKTFTRAEVLAVLRGLKADCDPPSGPERAAIERVRRVFEGME